MTRTDFLLDLCDPVPQRGLRWPAVERGIARVAPAWAARCAARRRAQEQAALARYVAQLQAGDRARGAAATPSWWSQRAW